MIKINKQKTVPSDLNNAEANKEFNKNISAKKYVGKNIYQKVKPDLEKLYNKKCAYCETNISAGGFFHIEHYRPKNEYYWLAYSWDNLLLSCPKCNINKGHKFDINGTKIKYNSQILKDLHDKISVFDKQEQPKLINPQQISNNELKEQFSFNLKGEIKYKSERMEYTIDTCKLNRKDLKNARLKILNNLKILYGLNDNKKLALKYIKKIINKSIINNDEYISWNFFLLENIARL